MFRIRFTFFLVVSFLLLLAKPGTAAHIDSIPGLVKSDSAIHFLVIGDWGAQGSRMQKKVAAAMSEAAEQLQISFVIATGDNFYPAGVTNVKDSQWRLSFENVYTASSLQVPWLAVLGNHDYTSNPNAQVDYTAVSKRWYMPRRYYDTSIAIGHDSMLLVFIDTEPIERQLRSKPADPSKYTSSYVDEQLQWLQQNLINSKAKWKIVTGHHPLHTGGSRRHNRRIKKLRRLIQPLLYQNNVNIYLSGHEHHLELLKQKRQPTSYIISGTGSDTRHVGWLKFYRRFAARKNGFAAVSVSPKAAVIQFISADGKLLYKRQL